MASRLSKFHPTSPNAAIICVSRLGHELFFPPLVPARKRSPGLSGAAFVNPFFTSASTLLGIQHLHNGVSFKSLSLQVLTIVSESSTFGSQQFTASRTAPEPHWESGLRKILIPIAPSHFGAARLWHFRDRKTGLRNLHTRTHLIF